jgi:hypothetical protein
VVDRGNARTAILGAAEPGATALPALKADLDGRHPAGPPHSRALSNVAVVEKELGRTDPLKRVGGRVTVVDGRATSLLARRRAGALVSLGPAAESQRDSRGQTRSGGRGEGGHEERHEEGGKGVSREGVGRGSERERRGGCRPLRNRSDPRSGPGRVPAVRLFDSSALPTLIALCPIFLFSLFLWRQRSAPTPHTARTSTSRRWPRARRSSARRLPAQPPRARPPLPAPAPAGRPRSPLRSAGRLPFRRHARHQLAETRPTSHLGASRRARSRRGSTSRMTRSALGSGARRASVSNGPRRAPTTGSAATGCVSVTGRGFEEKA